MDHFQQFARQIKWTLFGLLIAIGIVLTIGAQIIDRLSGNNNLLTLGIIIPVMLLACWLAAWLVAKFVLAPVAVVWQAVLHMLPDQGDTAPPDPDKLRFGRNFAKALVTQIYQFASQENGKDLAAHRQAVIQASNIVSNLPLPLFVFNKDQMVVNASAVGLKYCHIESSQLFGKKLFESINMEFPSEHTLEAWIAACQNNRVTDTAYWERVRIQLPDNKELRQCDMAAYYNRDNPSGTEFIVTLFDRTEKYNLDDQDIGFVALAVHELRTPLTILRGYIEVFDEELEGQLNPELTSYMQKLKISAQQLSTFFNNILNVARVENNQLTLHLTEGNWTEILQAAVDDLQLRAEVMKRPLQLMIADGLPTVAVDRVSIIEVINNLVENAFKYSPPGQRIVINAHVRDDGAVETTVQDTGVGIPVNVIPNLFDKFYRSHRSANHVGGTGLGLFLCKAIVEAHIGEIWVKSHEGEGSTFGFTLVPYSKLADELKNNDNEGIERGAHGWIKNHSIYRR